MFDIGTILFSSALKIVENLVLSWIDKKLSILKISDVEKQTSMAVKAEADKLRVRVEDLELETKKVRELLFSKMPEFTYVKSPLNTKLTIAYNPDAAYSANELLSKLKKRVSELEEEFYMSKNESTSTTQPSPSAMFIPVDNTETVDRNLPIEATISTRMLLALQERIKGKEDSRQ